MNEQISIWDLLGEKKEENKEWKPLCVQDYFEWESDKKMPLIVTYHEFRLTDKPDIICKGTVNGVPALIGFREWVSGWGSCFTEYEAFKWKEDT